jgi:hypothetical protein
MRHLDTLYPPRPTLAPGHSLSITARKAPVRLRATKEGDLLGARYPAQEWLVERKAVKP